MNPFSTAPDFILDSIFLKLNEEDLHETLRVSQAWFWASIRRIKKLEIVCQNNTLRSMMQFYNNKRRSNERMDWRELFKHLVLDELVVIGDIETINYLVNNGCNTAVLAINSSWKETPLTLESLTRVTRLQAFEYRTYGEVNWHSILIECFKTSDLRFDPNTKYSIEMIKLNFSGWNSEDPFSDSITKLEVRNVNIEFLRTLVKRCSNLEELHCSNGNITQAWRQVFPSNVKRIELHDVRLDDDVATIVNASTDSARHLLPYLCQKWESVEEFHFYGYIDSIGHELYEVFPQQREEVFDCANFNAGINLASPLIQCRKIRIKCYEGKALQLKIPPTKLVKLKANYGYGFKFSPRAYCLEPGKVERLDFSSRQFCGIKLEPFEPNSFEGFCRLTSLTLNNVSAASIKMALDQCPSIKKLKLKRLEAMTIDNNFPAESSYANVCELVLKNCKEPLDKVFHVFPCLSEFKLSVRRKDHSKKTDWLWRHLIIKDKKYGFVSQIYDETRYMVSDDLHTSLKEAQTLLKEFSLCECYLKGFKLIPRFSKQKVVYIN